MGFPVPFAEKFGGGLAKGEAEVLLGGGFASIAEMGIADKTAETVFGVVGSLAQDAEEDAGHFITKSLLVVPGVPEGATPQFLVPLFRPPSGEF